MKKKRLAIGIVAIALVAYIGLKNEAPSSLSPNDIEQVDTTPKVSEPISAGESVASPMKNSATGAVKVRKTKGSVVTEVTNGNGPGQVGVTEEGGGVGPTSFIVSDDGDVFVLDRMNDRILNNKNGAMETVVDLKGKFLKGMMLDGDDNLRVLTGNDTLELESYGLDGQKLEGQSVSFKPVHLNGMDVRTVGDDILISGAVENYSLTQDGVLNEIPGVPLTNSSDNNAKYMDSSLSEQGDAVILTFRDEVSSPVAEKKISGDFGGIFGTFPTGSGNIVLAVEGNGENPQVSFITLNQNGDVVDHMVAPVEGELIVDQKYQVSKDGCKAYQMGVDKNTSKIIEYDLKCM